MKKFILLFILVAVFISHLISQADFTEITVAELANVDYTIIFEDSYYKLIVVNGVT